MVDFRLGAKLVNKKPIFADLGIGKETSFYYPWHPGGSPNICLLANVDLGILAADDNEDPTTNCNEFVFTRQ